MGHGGCGLVEKERSRWVMCKRMLGRKEGKERTCAAWCEEEMGEICG